MGEPSGKEDEPLADEGDKEDIEEKSSSEIKQELSSAIESDWVPRPNDDSDIIHIPMNEEDLLDYEVDEVVNFKATLGHKTLRRTPSEYPVLHLAHSRCTNTLLSQVHAHTFTNSHFNLKCFCYFAGVQAGGTKGCANIDRNCLVVVSLFNFDVVLIDTFNMISEYQEYFIVILSVSFVNYFCAKYFYAYSAAITMIAHGLTGHACDFS